MNQWYTLLGRFSIRFSIGSNSSGNLSVNLFLISSFSCFNCLMLAICLTCIHTAAIAVLNCCHSLLLLSSFFVLYICCISLFNIAVLFLFSSVCFSHVSSIFISFCISVIVSLHCTGGCDISTPSSFDVHVGILWSTMSRFDFRNGQPSMIGQIKS